MTFSAEFVLAVVRGTPWWAWALLAFLVYRGVMARRGGVTSLPRLAIIPVVFTAWGLYGVVDLFHMSIASVTLWLASFVAGCGIGYWLGSRQTIRADRTRGLIELAGNPMLLVLSLIIFFVKYTLAVVLEINPGVRDALWFLLVDVSVSGTIAGMFAGRLFNYWSQYKTAAHVELTAS